MFRYHVYTGKHTLEYTNEGLSAPKRGGGVLQTAGVVCIKQKDWCASNRTDWSASNRKGSWYLKEGMVCIK